MKKLNENAKQIMLFLAFLLFVGSGNLLAQDITVSGTVKDKDTGEPMPGVSVYVKGTTNGTYSDVNGGFSISAAKDAVIVLSFIGYTTQEIPVNNQTSINIDLEAEAVALDVVVAIGYGTTKKKELTGAVSQLKTEEMTKIVSSDFTKALQGQIAGVSVVESSGRPGDKANINIRGIGSISSDANPLYVVDGIPASGNPNIPSEDIETVDVLKDGAAAAIYGTRASNGVILITTKRGKAGKTKISFNSYYGIQNITSGTPLLNTKEHLYVDEMVQQAQGSHSSILHYNPNAMNYDNDFVGYVTNDNAAIQNYNLALSGGKEDITFNINSNYFAQDGIIRQSGYDRFNTRANATLKKGKFSAFASLGIMHTNKEQEPWGVYEFAQFQGPYRPALAELDKTENTIIIPGNNPDHVGYLFRLLNQEDNRVEDSYNLSANLKYEIIEGLTYQVNLGMSMWKYNRKFWQPQYLVYDQDGELNKLGSREDATLTQDYQSSRKLTIENIVNYTKTFGVHKISALLGYTIEKDEYQFTTFQKKDFVSNNVSVFRGGKSLINMDGYDRYHAIVGKLARVQYGYAGKYLISASMRIDGSSNFGADNRYAMFPGVSVAWNVSEENFLNSIDIIENLKLRASYGEVGNEGISPYLYAAYIDPNVDYVWGTEADDELGAGAIQRGYANSDVKWETNISRNIGLDLLMYNGKFSFTADVYQNDKKDMLLRVLLPPSTGTTILNDYSNAYNSKITNVGNMVNKGIELSSYFKHQTKFGLNWQITGTFTKNKNEILDLGDLEEIALAGSEPANWRRAQQDITTYMRPGCEAGAFFLIETDGIFKTQEELDAHVHTNEDGSTTAIQPNAQLGDVKMLDANNDGKIDDEDRVYAGSGLPEFEAGLILTADYKNFDLSAQLFYSHGNEVYNGSKLFAYAMKRHKDLYYMWTPQNPTSDIPAGRPNSEHDNTRARTDYFLEDASFLRVRNISLGYTIPKTVLKKSFDNIRVYVTAQNPFTFTKYEGYDPEIGGNGISTRGIDVGNYPITRKFLIGAQFNF